MGLFGFLKKKETDELEIPPPPLPIEEDVGGLHIHQEQPAKAVGMAEKPSGNQVVLNIPEYHFLKKEGFSAPEHPFAKDFPDGRNRLQRVNLPHPPRIEDYLISTPKMAQKEEVVKEQPFGGIEPIRIRTESKPVFPVESADRMEVKPGIPVKWHIDKDVPIIKAGTPLAEQRKSDEDSVKLKKELLDRDFLRKPIFIKSEGYKDISDSIINIRNRLRETEKITTRLNEIKNIKDKELEKWRAELEDIQRKTAFIDKTLFEGEK